MYIQRSETFTAVELEQGDVITGMHWPGTADKGAPHFRDGNKTIAAKDEELQAPEVHRLKILIPAKEGALLVLSNACDHVRGENVVLAPVRPLKLRMPQAKDQFAEVQSRATGGSTPREFYLPPTTPQLPTHHTALFDELFTLDCAYIDRYCKNGLAKRLLGMNLDGTTHLRWAISFFFGRNPRDDFAWQTDEVLALRHKALSEMIQATPRSDFKEQLALVEKEITRRKAPQLQVVPMAAPSTT